MGISLEKRQRFRIEFADLSEIVGIADLGEPRELLLSRQTGQVVDLVGVNASDVTTNRFRKWRLAQKLHPRRRSHAQDQPIFTKSLAVEETRGIQLLVKLLIVILVKTLSVDAQISDQALSHFAVSGRALDRLRSTIAEQHPVPRAKLVALGVSTKIVVVVEDENPRIRRCMLAIEVSSSQPANSASHDDQIVFLTGALGFAGRVPEFSVTQAMRGGVRAFMIPAHSHQGWR